jgi:sulfur carrier protein ThiS
MSELNVKYGEIQRSIPAPASVADAIKAFDRDVLKRSLAAKVNGEEVDLNKELSATDEVLSIEPRSDSPFDCSSSRRRRS